MEQLQTEVTRLSNELDAVQAAVRAECDTLRQLFTQAAAQQRQQPQQRRLNHREADRHLPQAFGGNRQDYADFAFRLESYASILSADGEGGNLLKEVASANQFDTDLMDRLDTEYWDVKPIGAAIAAALISCTRGEVAVLVRRVLGADPGNGLHCWYAITQWFRPRSVVEEASSIARLIAPKRAKTVSELQVAVMNWELALAEHQARFTEPISDSVKTAALRSMIPKELLDRFLDGPFDYEGLRARVGSYVGEKLAATEGHSDPKPMDIGEVEESSDEEDEVAAVNHPRRQGPQGRAQVAKTKQASQQSHRHPPPPDAPVSKPGRRQADSDGSGDGLQKDMKKRRKVLICYKCGGKEHPAKVCPSEDDVQDVDEAETDQQDNLMGGIDWADEPSTDLNEVRNGGGKVPTRQPLLAFIDSGAVDNVLPKDVCAHVPLEKTARSRSGMGFRGANGALIHHYGQALSRGDGTREHHEHQMGGCGCAEAINLGSPAVGGWAQARPGRQTPHPVQAWTRHPA